MAKISKVNQKFAIQKDLFHGWGVEDIAIRTGIPIKDVRAEVQRLRGAGELNEIYGIKKPHSKSGA